jgi:hypothetical protein
LSFSEEEEDENELVVRDSYQVRKRDTVKGILMVKGLKIFNSLIETFSPKEGNVDKEFQVLKCFP